MDLVRVNATPSVDEPRNVIYTFEKVEDGKGTGIFYLITAASGTFHFCETICVKGPVVEMSEYVPQFFTMNPETDDLLPNGRYLEEGMTVLIEDYMLRANPENIKNGYDQDRADRYNRWALIDSNPTITGHGSGVVSFVAKYKDGTKKKICVGVGYAWYVKKTNLADSV